MNIIFESPDYHRVVAELRSRKIKEQQADSIQINVTPQYIVGFTDGKGCFCISFRRRNKLKFGIECTASFVIEQKKSKKNYALLKSIRDFFTCGGIRYSKGDNCYKYEIRSLPAIKEKIIPFFQKDQLLSEKATDFYYFSDICSLMSGQQHLNKKGLIRILELADKMNASGTRKVAIKNLRVSLQEGDDKLIQNIVPKN